MKDYESSIVGRQLSMEIQAETKELLERRLLCLCVSRRPEEYMKLEWCLNFEKRREKMPYIKSFELDRWSEPDEKGCVRHIGMINMDEAFEKLKAHLEGKNMLPDEYFSCNFNRPRIARELPDFRYALCNANIGASEGVYLDIDLIYEIDGEDKMLRFATGKTLKEGADAFLWMSRIAAECSLMLNGRGCVYEKNCTELVLQKDEAEVLSSLLDQRQQQEISGQEQEILYAIREQLAQNHAAETPTAAQEAEETDDEELER